MIKAPERCMIGVTSFLLGYGWVTFFGDHRAVLFCILGVFIFFYNPKRAAGENQIFKDIGIIKKKGDLEEVPKIIWKRETESGFEAGLKLPVGLTTGDCRRKTEAFEEAFNAQVDFRYQNGKTIMKVNRARLENHYDYKPMDVTGSVEIPIGYSVFGLETLSFDSGYPHLLVGGQTRWGKSVFLRQAIVNLVLKSKVRLHLIDFKCVEFAAFRNVGCVESYSRTNEEAWKALRKLEGIMEDRYALFERSEVVNIQDYNRKFPHLDYHVLIIDEYADTQDNSGIQAIVDKIIRKSGAAGIHGIICTQRPSADIIRGSIKANLPATLAFRTKNSLNSRILLDENDAAEIEHRGRAIFQTDRNLEVQVMYLSDEKAREMIKPYISLVKQKPICDPPKPKIETQPEGVISIEAYRKRSENNCLPS